MASATPTSVAGGGAGIASRAGRALLVMVLLELGLLLLVLPWTGAWQHNYFLQQWPWLRDWALSPYVRGAVSGWGLVNLWLGTGEIVRLPR
ncbi:MAG: hypothetical protein ACRD2E_10785 [Terriglobales bacterium]